jgi:hypothetical protein
MATRQRAPASNKTAKKQPAPPRTSDDVTGDNAATAADVPGVDFSGTAAAELPQARFIGEQVIYKSREERIAESAYLLAEARGFAPGYDVEDWLEAEKEIDALLSGDGYRAD